jgi:hypothetical protein
LGALYPFSRNHNAIEIEDQDSAAYTTTGHPEVTEDDRNSMPWRHLILKNSYTLFFREYVIGETVI